MSLISKLTALNLNPHLLQRIVNYLSNRQQYIGVNGKTSTTSQVMLGVLQGSVLGPHLFLIYIDDITNVELNDGNLLLYADDILLYHPIYCLDDYVHLQQKIDKLYLWSEVNLLQFNSVEETCKSSSKQFGLIYRIFYLHSSQATLRSLYVSLEKEPKISLCFLEKESTFTCTRTEH